MKKRILVTNDDGIFSEGIRLPRARRSPRSPRSPSWRPTASRARAAMRSPCRGLSACRRCEENWYAVDGTPTDCVNLAVLFLLKDQPPDFVCSGINFGTQPGRRRDLLGHRVGDLRGDAPGHPLVRLQPGDRRGLLLRAGGELRPRASSRPSGTRSCRPTCCSTSTCRPGEIKGVSLHQARPPPSTSSRWSRSSTRAAASTTGSPAPRSGSATAAPTSRPSPRGASR